MSEGPFPNKAREGELQENEELDHLLSLFRHDFEAKGWQRSGLGFHEYLSELANDPEFTTQFLVERALDHLRQELDNELEAVNFPLVLLQHRSGGTAVEAAYRLLDHHAGAKQILGAQILGEHPDLDRAPYPHSEEAVERLEKLVHEERDQDVLFWMLAAMAWQRLPRGMAILLRFKDDKRDAIRKVVADNLLLTTPEGESIAPEIRDAYVQFLNDPDVGIQWSALWDIAESPSYFVEHRSQLERAIQEAHRGFDEENLELAQRALTALETGQSRSGD